MKKGQIKTERVMAALEHREGDRVPVGEFFWTNFIRRVKAETKVEDDFDPYRHWDLDLIVITPNMDPHITGIEVLEDTPERKRVKTGFGATIERVGTLPMPAFLDFETQTFEQMEAFEFDDPKDRRRYFEAIDDQINSVGDELNLGLPSFIDRVNAYADDFCVFGSVCEPHEMIWRMVGTENALLKLGEDPERVAEFVERLGDFLVGIVEGQIAAAEGKLSGLYIWGDIAYVRGMFFSPDCWRSVYKPHLKRICRAAHAAGLKTIYHGCGNA
ncbi:MAG TPA: uroporphyrinogen decarboxylase family protein, partial [Sumerlaeia bacterium]|nr:uroporphyrinogen decarboxylase family protein [Sumerlaeia bacterium]